MGEHNHNPQALAKKQGGEVRQVIDLGKGCGLIGFDIQTMIDGEGVAHAMLVAIGGRTSSLVPMQPVGVVVKELAAISVVELRKHFGVAEEPAVSGLVEVSQ